MYSSADCSQETSADPVFWPADVNLAWCAPVTWRYGQVFYSKSTCNSDSLVMRLYSDVSCNEGSRLGANYDRIIDSTNLMKMKAGKCFGATTNGAVLYYK